MMRTFGGKNGNIVAMLMGTVAMVGIVGVSAMNMIGGPITTAAKVTHQNMAQNDLLMNAKVVVMNASTRPNMGDEDGDGYIEPVPFVPASDPSCGLSLPAGGQGGCLPADIGAILTDPWGTSYAYCVWDHGDPASSPNRIDGEDSTSGAVLAIISAGPNKRFETPCRPYDGDPDTNDIAIDPRGIGDDLVQIYTYAAAVAGSGGLWELKLNEPTTAAIAKDIEVDGAFRMGFAGESEGEVGTNACTQGSHIGRMRFNPFDNAIEVCSYEDSLYEWQTMTGGGVKVIVGDDISLYDLFEVPDEYRPDPCHTGVVGTACTDGAIYAGTLGVQRIYAAPADEATTLSWNNGSGYTVTGATSLNDGLANTNTLVGLSDAGAPYAAAVACRAKGPGWYLPAIDELNVLYTNRSAIGGFKTSGQIYWSSSESAIYYARTQIFNHGAASGNNKPYERYVRCVRR